MTTDSAKKRFAAGLLTMALLFGATTRAAPIAVSSFEGAATDAEVRAESADIELTEGAGVTDGGRALRVAFRADTAYSGVTLGAESPWKPGELGDCRLSFDVTNVGETSVHLRCEIKTANHASVRRGVAIAAGETVTCYFELVSDEAYKDHGLRDDPPSLEGVGRKMLSKGVKQPGDYSTVRSIKFYVIDAVDDDVIVLDHLRFVSSPAPSKDYLKGIVDEFGQRVSAEFPEKVGSEAELRRRAEQELAQLAAGGPMADRSAFGGWKAGPRLEATGYFRTEKVRGKWSLVDPEGCLHFATGIDNLRMANTSTFTGIDFLDDSVRYRDPGDITPEDSIGIVPSSAAVRRSRHDAQPWRRGMFTWLPEYDDPLAKHYGYRRSSHKGPIQHGEVFSFYRANLERRYGDPSPGGAVSVWRDATIDRMLNWGFTSLGNWTDPMYYDNTKIPFFANGWIIGDFSTVSSGNDYWRAMPDPFDPEFVRRAEITTKAIADEVKGTPWCVGVFVDNEMSWGSMGSPASRYAIVINTLGRGAGDSPTKAAFVKLLRAKYPGIADLNDAWGTGVASWAEFEAGFPKQPAYENEAMLADFSMLSEAYAEEYFRVVHDALARVMPNHLYLGCRFTTWGMTEEVSRAASRYCDVMSYNFYREALGERVWRFLPEVDRPSIIGEWHIGSTDSGLPHPGLIHAADQEDRGRMYRKYLRSVIDNPYFVGAHWFQYIDSPLTGRAHDGENYNAGFVTIADVPYAPLVEAATEVNRELYTRRFGDPAE